MEITLDDVNRFGEDDVEFVRWMASKKFICVDDQQCALCASTLVLQVSEHFAGDGVCLRCTNVACSNQRSVRSGSFFSRSHYTLRTQMKLIAMFAADATVASTAAVLGLSRRRVTDYFDNCRGEYADALDPIHGYAPIVFSIEGEYELDECVIKAVRTPHGAASITIAGILERRTGKVLMYRVPDRSSLSLLPPVWQNIPRGSRVYSDSWPAYVNAPWEEHGLSHWHVNHSANEYSRAEQVTFGDGHSEVLDVHCNTLEGLWSLVRRRLAYKTRRNVERIDLLLKEIMWRRCGLSLLLPFTC